MDAAVREGLVASLVAIFAALDAPRGPHDPELAALLAAIRSGPVRPGLFGLYVELVLAIFADRMDEAAVLEAHLLREPVAPARGLRVCTLNDADLGAGQAARYQRLLARDIACPIAPLDPAAFDAARRRLSAALELLGDGAPDVFAEFEALVREVVLVRPEAAPGGRTFGAASSFSLWGAIAMNAVAMGGRLELALQLAHEAAHTHLFGLALGGRITENDEAERYGSPLRSDPRPMEGVAHAVFVTGRMIFTLDTLIASGGLDAAETARASGHLAELEAAQAAGLQTVRMHGRLAPAGQAAFAGLGDFLAARRLAAVQP
jgi:HEXXH motif-containing protein